MTVLTTFMALMPIMLASTSSTGADLKGLMKAAYYDPNPVVMLEHKGLYWSKIKGTEGAMTVEPDEDYIIPFGKSKERRAGTDVTVIAYGNAVHLSGFAAQELEKEGVSVEVIDAYSVKPLDWESIKKSIQKTGNVVHRGRLSHSRGPSPH